MSVSSISQSNPQLKSSFKARLILVLLGNALLRVANFASGTLIAAYLVKLASESSAINAELSGNLDSVTNIAEVLGALPMGVLSDAFAPRSLMIVGGVLGAVATQIFGISGAVAIFFLSRALEGLAAATSSPSVLAHLTDVTEKKPELRGKVMSFYEVSLLGGLALGTVTGSILWSKFGVTAFALVATIYFLSAVLMGLGGRGSKKHGTSQALAGLLQSLRDPLILRLAPAWLCINAIVGLWLGATVKYLLAKPSDSGQFLAGLFADNQGQIGYIFLVYAIVFATGVTIWSFLLARFTRKRVLNIALIGMFFACLGFYLLNHSNRFPNAARPVILAFICGSIMVESGFTPAALALLADVVGAQGGRGAAMGIYSVLLGVGAAIGSYIAGKLGNIFSVDGLIYGTAAMAVIAFLTVLFLPNEANLSS